MGTQIDDAESTLISILTCVLTIILHEVGHIVAALAFNLKVKAIGISRRCRPYIRHQSGTVDQNVVVSLSGPGLNIALALVFWHTGFGLLNLVFGVVNLLPLRGSDGWCVKHLLEQDARMRRILGR